MQYMTANSKHFTPGKNLTDCILTMDSLKYDIICCKMLITDLLALRRANKEFAVAKCAEGVRPCGIDLIQYLRAALFLF